MDVIIALWKEFETPLIALLLTLPRTYAFLSSAQLVAGNTIPAVPRAAAMLALASLAVPINLDHAAAVDSYSAWFFLQFAKEYALGFLLGYLIGMIFWVVQAAGGLIDNQRGAAIATSIDPLLGEEASPLGNLFSQAFLTYIFTSGSFLLALGMLYKSYLLWPITSAIPNLTDAFPGVMLLTFDNAMRLAFVLALPIIAIMFVAEFALAIVSRFAPQIQVFVLAMPLKSILAILGLILYLAPMFHFSDQQFLRNINNAGYLLDMLKFGYRSPAPRSADPGDQRRDGSQR
jgi:type III secretion protein T